MKKFALALSCLFALCLNPANGFGNEDALNNPAFGGRKNQISVTGGISSRSQGLEGSRKRIGQSGEVTSGSYRANESIVLISYSQPTTFFRMHARRSLELGKIFGRKDGVVENSDGTFSSKDFSQYEQIIGGALEEVVLGWRYCYLTLGIGAYIKSKSENRLNSKFTFGERASLGTNIGPMNLEAYIRHFSNGTRTSKNAGHNFVGLSLGAKF